MDHLEHLLNLAEKGSHPAASSGERRARAIVECLLENVLGLDASATAGIEELIVLIQTQPMAGRDQIREIVGID